MQVTAARREDCLALATIHVTSWQAAYASLFAAEYLASLSVAEREKAWLAILEAAASRTLVARRDDEVLGFVSFGRCRDEGAPASRGEIWALYVSPHAWSAGAGWALWEAARVQMLHAGYSQVSLWVLSGNVRGLRFYEAVGFRAEPRSEQEFEQGGATLREVRLVFEHMSAHPSLERTPRSKLRSTAAAAAVERQPPPPVEPALSAIYNCRVVNESLCTSGQPTAAQLGAIAAAGFAAIINLALHDDPRYSLPDERGVVESLGLAYIHIPVAFGAPTASDLSAFFAAMDAHGGERLWIHCAANIRVTAFLGLYRVIKLGWPAEPAFALMRGLWQPNAVWSSFIAAALEKHGG